MSNQIMDNLWQVGGGELTSSADAAAYLIRFGKKAALIDSGTGTGHSALVANIEACLPSFVDLEFLFLTHCHFDHSGGAQGIRETFGCKIVVHELDATYLQQGDNEVTAASWYGTSIPPLEIDMVLKGENTTLKCGNGQLEAIHWPGHSPGSVVFTTQIEEKLILFGQDIHGPIHPSLLSDQEMYQQSLKKILQLNADLLLEGHYGVFQGRSQVEKFIGSFLT